MLTCSEKQLMIHSSLKKMLTSFEKIFLQLQSPTSRRLYSMSAMETTEQCVESAKVNHKDTKTKSMMPFWCFYC